MSIDHVWQLRIKSRLILEGVIRKGLNSKTVLFAIGRCVTNICSNICLVQDNGVIVFKS